MATTATNAPVIRPVEISDARLVAELSGQLGYEATEEQMRQRVARLAGREDRHIVLVACVDGSVVAWIEAALEDHLQSEPFAIITGLVVGDGTRSSGIGKLLCQSVEQWAREQGVKVLRVTSRSTRERAHQFYLRDGFSIVKTSLVFEKKL
jgi:GNAT superfamily N-acetyltransferase